ncbi:hypothetical protein [Streptomyces sp. NPDC088360]|uniref:hypothetical protein n=1 Tax=Streptomyces sp. NPDC088360 TaxID=3154515 RepID=UPI00344C073B
MATESDLNRRKVLALGGAAAGTAGLAPAGCGSSSGTDSGPAAAPTGAPPSGAPSGAPSRS